MKKYLLFLLFASLLLSACAAGETSLVGTWILTAYGPQGATTPVASGSQAWVTFDKNGSLSGTSGCNSFGGNYKVEGDQVTFSNLASTLMACADPLMTQEGTVFKVMNGTATYRIDGDILTIENAGMVLEFKSGKPEAYPAYPQ
jgi:heat shock protein HslJ